MGGSDANVLAAFEAAVARAPDGPAIRYFDGVLSYAALDAASERLAAFLRAGGVVAGARVALYLQNVPGFVIGLVAAWKLGAVPVPINPMNRARELTILFADCTPAALICHDTLVVEAAAATAPPALVVTTSCLDFQRRDDEPLFAGVTRLHPAGTHDLCAIFAAAPPDAPPGALADAPPDAPSSGPATDIAMLVYTSGTTGVPKGSMSTHAGVLFAASRMCDWLDLPPGAPILGLAPLFHITGLICQVVTAIILAAPLVLSYRFAAGTMLAAIAEHRPYCAIGAITAFVAMMNHQGVAADAFAPLRHVCSGGAPVPASVAAEFRARFGQTLLNAFGMTETNAAVTFTPKDTVGRVDPASGVLSIGVALPGNRLVAIDEAGDALPAGEIGELVIASPGLTAGYWGKPAETAAVLTPAGLRSGDVGFLDADGWAFLVDRKKDMINASGYKVWPREVEDVLYAHPAVREAAVIGVPDGYRGETVKAVISLKPGASIDPAELVAFCRAQMAAYKYPRQVVIMDELPKTTTGKIMRRALRD